MLRVTIIKIIISHDLGTTEVDVSLLALLELISKFLVARAR